MKKSHWRIVNHCHDLHERQDRQHNCCKQVQHRPGLGKINSFSLHNKRLSGRPVSKDGNLAGIDRCPALIASSHAKTSRTGA